MSCQRAQEIDLDLYLVDPRASEWEEFREHFPACPDCAATLEAASVLEERLEAALGGAHPAPPVLLAAFEASTPSGRAPRPNPATSGVSPDEVRAARSHLEQCRSCRNMLSALGDFVSSPPAGAAEAASAQPEADGSGLLEAIRAWLGSLGKAPLALSGGLVAAAAAAFWLVWSGGSTSEAPAPAPPLAVSPAPEPRAVAPEDPDPAPPREETTPGAAPRIAGTSTRRRSSSSNSEDAPFVAPEPPPPWPAREEAREVVAEEAPAAEPEVVAEEAAAAEREVVAEEAPAAEPAPAPAPSPPRDEAADPAPWVLAMATLPPPTYSVPGNALPEPRVLEVSRSASAEVPPDLVALAPEAHAGRTRSQSPSFYWFQSAPADRPLRFTLLGPNDDVLLEVKLAPASRAGIRGLALADHGIRLTPGRAYRWFVGLTRGAGLPGVDPLTGATVQALSADRSAPVARETAQALASRGLWYDALAAISRAIDLEGDPRLRRQRAALLEQVGLEQAAAFDRSRS